MILGYPSNRHDLDLQKWRPAKWSSIEQGDLLALSLEHGTVAVGTVDDYTFDRSVLWLRLSQTAERRCFLSSEIASAWSPPQVMQAKEG
jgi:hypothetical protein